MNNRWYIKWYNDLPPKSKVNEAWDYIQYRTVCPSCGVPTVAKENADGEVYIDIEHSPDCKLNAEWIQFEKNTPGISDGERWLVWCHRKDT